jgi:hypothetical protein
MLSIQAEGKWEFLDSGGAFRDEYVSILCGADQNIPVDTLPEDKLHRNPMNWGISGKTCRKRKAGVENKVMISRGKGRKHVQKMTLTVGDG